MSPLLTALALAAFPPVSVPDLAAVDDYLIIFAADHGVVVDRHGKLRLVAE